jgi:hypothetical protein
VAAEAKVKSEARQPLGRPERPFGQMSPTPVSTTTCPTVTSVTLGLLIVKLTAADGPSGTSVPVMVTGFCESYIDVE